MKVTIVLILGLLPLLAFASLDSNDTKVDVLDAMSGKESCNRYGLNQSELESVDGISSEQDIIVELLMGKKSLVSMTGGTSSNKSDEDHLYLGCDKNITISEYLGEKGLLLFNKYSEEINKMYSAVNLSKELETTHFCTTKDVLLKYSTFEYAKTSRSASWLPERINGDDLIKISVHHDSFKQDDTAEKVNIVIKELLHNYIPGSDSNSRTSMSNSVYTHLFKSVVLNKVSKKDAIQTLTQRVPGFPATKVDELERYKRKIGRLEEQIIMLKKHSLK